MLYVFLIPRIMRMAARVDAPKTSSGNQSLSNLLDGLVLAQRQDIHAFSAGHLNESNLRKPKAATDSKSWKSAKKPVEKMVPKVAVPRAGITCNSKMQDALVNFTIGTAGNVVSSNSKSTKKKVLKPVAEREKGNMKLRKIKVLKSKDNEQSAGTEDGIFVEELVLPETMPITPRTISTVPPSSESRGKRSGELPHTSDTSRASSVSGKKDLCLDILFRHEFVPAHQQTVTKRDQLHKLREFEEKVLRKDEAQEQDVMSGTKAVDHLEMKLKAVSIMITSAV